VRELNEGAPTFLRAGYALTGVDMELGIAPRVTAHLERLEEVGIRTIRDLLAPNCDRRVIHGILSALVKAEELAESTQFEGMEPTEVSIQVGPAPTVRLRWRTALPEVKTSAPKPPPIPGTVSAPKPDALVAPPATVPAPVSPFGQNSFFEPRSMPVAPVRSVNEAVAEPQPSSPATVPKPVVAAPVTTDPLARFKRMPDLAKQRR
jgi:hypothetical protein